MGKRQIAQMQPLDVVITLIIADLATIPMSDLTIPLLNGIIPLFVLTILHFTLTFLSCKIVKVRNIVNGTAVILVGPEGIIEKNVQSLNLTVADILESCRSAGYLSLEDVLYVIMETNGNISIIPKSDSTEITRSDLKIKGEEPPIPYLLISDGKICTNNLKRFGISPDELKSFLKQENCTLKDTTIMQYDKNGHIYLQSSNKVKTFDKKLGYLHQKKEKSK